MPWEKTSHIVNRTDPCSTRFLASTREKQASRTPFSGSTSTRSELQQHVQFVSSPGQERAHASNSHIRIAIAFAPQFARHTRHHPSTSQSHCETNHLFSYSIDHRPTRLPKMPPCDVLQLPDRS